MRTLSRAIAVLFACSLVLAGCDSLDLQPRDELPSESVWSDSELTKSFLNSIYENTGHGYSGPMFAAMMDDAQNPKDDGNSTVWLSNMSPTDRGKWDQSWNSPMSKFHWEHVYSNVRDLNIFLRNVEESEALSADTKETLLGEAYFLRAWFYHSLLRAYGGVPTIANTFDLTEDLAATQVPRNTFEGTVDFVVADLDSAAARLPLQGRATGTATRGAALALKCRVRVHAASDLFAADKSPFDMEEVKYTGGSQQDRWQTAQQACQEVIDLGEYSLEQTASAEEYHELFTKGNESGTIWARHFSEAGGESHDISLFLSPNGWRGWSGETPTQQHVDAYEMADGSTFEWEGGDPESANEPIEVDKNPYEDRDPRFYANIHYNAAEWISRPSGVQGIDPRGVIQTGWYEDPDRGGSAEQPGIQGEMRPGLDTRDGPIEPWNGTRSGYVTRKFVDKDIDPKNEQAFNSWIFMRYAEVLLNKAEAEAELGNTGAALTALNEVRTRVGMPRVTESDLTAERTLMDRIRRERRVELFMEEFRYFDARRWMIAPEVHENAKGVRVYGELDPDGRLLGQHRYTFKYNVFEVDERRWEQKSYFVPIAREDMNQNPELVQNPGY